MINPSIQIFNEIFLGNTSEEKEFKDGNLNQLEARPYHYKLHWIKNIFVKFSGQSAI